MKQKMHGGESKLSHLGRNQGDMSPHVDDFQRPTADFAEEGFSKTVEYIERQDKHQKEMASDIKKQHYKGRYS